MGLFDKLKKKPEPVEISFPQAKGFRGFKKFPVVVHGNEEAERNNLLLSGEKMDGKTITFRQGWSEVTRSNYFDVLIDGKKVGAIFSDSQLTELQNGAIDAVYVKFEDGRIKMFVNYN